MKRFLFLSAVLSVCAIAAPFGACVPGSLVGHIGNACASSDRVFENFSYSGNADASSINLDFQMVGVEFRLLWAPVTGAGVSTPLSFVDKTTVQPEVTPDIPPDNYQVAGIDDESNSSLAPSTPGQPTSLQLGDIPADIVVPEPASFALIGAGLLCLGLLRRAVLAPEVIQDVSWKVK